MKYLGSRAAFCCAFAVVLSFSACKSASAQSALTQSQADKLAAQATINGCNADRSQLAQTVKLGKPDANGHIREKYGPVMVYPVLVTWTGSCVGKVMGRTDFYSSISARYTASFYRNDFGEWAHTPYVGKCSWSRVAYQMDGATRSGIPNAVVDSCALMDLSNQ